MTDYVTKIARAMCKAWVESLVPPPPGPNLMVEDIWHVFIPSARARQSRQTLSAP